MLKFAEILKSTGRNFTWTVCGDNVHMRETEAMIKESVAHIEEISFVGYKSNVVPTLVGADYSVFLSDWEGCPYGVLESLSVGVPCIVSNWNGVEELIEDGVNGYILRKDMKNIDIDKILNNIPKGFDVSAKSSIKDWEKLIDIRK